MSKDCWKGCSEAEIVSSGKTGQAVEEYSPTKEEPMVRGKSPPPFPEGGGLNVVV